MFRTNSKSIAITSVFIALFFILAIGGIHSVHALSFPTGITNYVALNISNSQSTATPNPFQQMINITSADNGWTYINTNQTTAFGQNVEFFYANGTIIPSWLENYTSTHALWWVKVGSIAASSKLTIYMGFANKTTNLFNNKTTGEAPQLSSTYAEYDDGANVFTNYWNFAGTSLPSGLTIGETGGNYSVNNGLTITGGSSYEGIFSTSSINPQTTITDFYGYLTGTVNYNSQFGLYGNTSAGEPQYFIWTPVADNYSLVTYDGTIGTKTTITTSGSQTSSSVWSMWASTTYAYASYNYGTAVSNNANFVASTAQYIGIQAHSTSNGAFVQWLRTRAYPPNGVMPSISFGSVQSTPVITLYLNGVSNANATITYGTESNFTTVMTPSTDYVSLYVNGTKVASLTQGKAVYLKTLAAGLYKITAATNTSGVANVTYYERINKATPTESITSTPSNFTYNGTKMTITGSISTLNNQLSSTFSINSNTIGTTTTSISYSNATANTYTATISTSGNQNYTSATLTKTFEIAKATPTLTATVNGKALGSYTIRASNLSLNGTVSPSLLTANFYDNGKLLGTSPQNITYGFSTLGNNVIVFNTSGNENYTSATITGTINLTTNQFTIQDVEQSGTSFSTFNLTISNSTKSKSFTNLAYGSKILYSDLPQGDLTFNFTANLADYNWTTETAANSIFTTTNQTVQGKQWEWIYFNAYVKQTGTALSAYNYTLTTSTSYKLAANLTNNPIKVSLQYLYPKSNLTIRKFGYNVTSNIYSFTLSPSANTIAVSVSEAGIVIYGINALTSTSLKNMTLLFVNGTAQKTYSNVTLPFSLYSGFLTGNVVITASKSPEDNISYTTADYYVTLTDQSTLNLTTYLFDDTYATTATFQTQYSYGGLASGAVVYLQSSVSPFKILEECKTLGSGQCQMALVTAASYQYYAAVPDTNKISVVSPLSVVSTTSGSGGACPTGIWCSYLSTPPPTLITLPTMNITSSPSTSFVAANQPLDFTATVSTTQNDLGGLELNTSVYVNDTYVNSTFVSVNTNPTKQTISKTTIAPNDSYNAEIIENVTILTSNGQEHFTYTYYVEGTASTVGNPTITAIFKNFGKGLGQYGPIIFLIILTGAAIMMWVLTESILFTQLVLDALSGFFAYAGVFSGALAPYGDALGWGLFGIFLVFTIMYQLSNVGGMG